MMNILPGEKDGGQTNGWGIVFHKHNFLLFYHSFVVHSSFAIISMGKRELVECFVYLPGVS